MIKNTFTVLFIDEDKSERYKFQEYAENFEEINAEVIAPPEKINEIIQRIMEGDIDAVISDFDLKDKGDSATYFGDEVIEIVLENKPDFPVFIFTSVEPQALEHSQSVHYVYDKKLMNDKEKTFLSKVLKEIKNYYERIEKWKNDFAKLKLKKIKNKISAKEEEYLIELDSLLEKSINQKTSIATQIKSDQKETLETLIKKTDEILEEVKSKLNKK